VLERSTFVDQFLQAYALNLDRILNKLPGPYDGFPMVFHSACRAIDFPRADSLLNNLIDRGKPSALDFFDDKVFDFRTDLDGHRFSCSVNSMAQFSRTVH
jgi:hypothetical protein